MRVRVVTPAELGDAEAARWWELQAATARTLNPFYSLTYARAVGHARPGARVAVVEDGGVIVAFLPFEMGRQRIGRPIGWPANDLQGFVGGGSTIDARTVVRLARLRGWRFDHAPADAEPLGPHQYRGSLVHAPVIELGDGYGPYEETVRGVHGRLLADNARKRRALERAFGPVVLERPRVGSAHLQRMVDWRSERYPAARQLLGDPGFRATLEELAGASRPDCAGSVHVLRAGERVVAVHVGLQGPTGLSWWYPAYDRELRRFSPGIMLVLLVAEELAGRGVARIDLGYGQDPWKFDVATGSYPVAGGAVWAHGVEAAARRAYRVGRERLRHRRGDLGGA